MKRLTAIALAIIMTAAVSCDSRKSGSGASGNDAGNGSGSEEFPEIEVTFMDVGKADCMVIRSGETTAVIDCGEKDDGKDLVKFLQKQDVKTVDKLIITHYDKDHVGGAAKLIELMDVRSVIGPDYNEKSDEFDKFRSAMRAKGIGLKCLREDMEFELGGANYRVYAPERSYYGPDDENDFSLVVRLDYHDTSMIFAADAMEQRLSEVMDIGSCDLLKVPYHGRKIANLDSFLDEVSPEYAVVSTSEKEYSSNTSKLLEEHGAEVFTTFDDGDITAVTNGCTISISTDN